MAAQYGVNVTILAQAARPITVQSTTYIGIASNIKGLEKAKIYEKAGYSETEEWPLLGFSNASEAKEFIEALLKENSIQDKRLLDTLLCIENQGVVGVIILSFFGESEDSDETLVNCAKAITDFKKAQHKTGYKPDILIAPYYSHEAGIKSALESTATAMNIIAVTDLFATNAGEALNAIKAYSSRRLIACWPFVQILSSTGYKYVPQSPIIAGMIAKTDGGSEYGFSDSYSNRVMLGVTGMEHFVEYEPGIDCDADRLRSSHISTVINYSGFRSWGGETTDTDSIWQDLARVRIFDRISKACQDGVFFAIDKKASELYHAKRSVEELLRALVGAKVLLGFELSWSEKNTLANITAGKFYLDVRMQNNPIVKQLTLDFIYVDSYGETLMNELNK